MKKINHCFTAAFTTITAFTGIAVITLAASICHAVEPTEPDRPLLEKTLAAHLTAQGDICLGKPEWPIDVTGVDIVNGTRDAVQMPVLEKLGLVAAQRETLAWQSDKGRETTSLTRYTLTDAGRRYYKQRSASDAGTESVETDFCAGKLSLDKLMKWEKTAGKAGHDDIVVFYTFTMTVPEWSRDPEARKVFPMIDRMIAGQGSMQLQQRFRRNGDRWVAIKPWE